MLLQLTITTDVDDAEREEPAAASGDDAVQKDTASADTASSENQQVTAETTATRLVNNERSSRRRLLAAYNHQFTFEYFYCYLYKVLHLIINGYNREQHATEHSNAGYFQM